MLTPILYALVYDRVVSSGSMETYHAYNSNDSSFNVLRAFEWARSRLLIAANVRLEASLRGAVTDSAFRNVLYTGNVGVSFAHGRSSGSKTVCNR